ncbi:MAG: alpha/beta hydrolase [Bacteroidota bacterium]
MSINGRRAWKFLLQVLIAAVVAVAIWSILLMFFEESFIFFPSKYPSGYYDIAARSQDIRDCWIVTEDGLKLHGWFIPAENPVATAVVSHGNAGNVSHRLDFLRHLQRAGFNVLMYDYRGYGRSEGTPSELGIYRDGKAAYEYAIRLPEVDPTRMILWGTSLGGAVAVDVATHCPAAGLILESTFTSAQDVAKSAYPFLPFRFLLRTKLNSIDRIRTLTPPILFLHGSKDRIIPFGLGRKLFESANEPKEFYSIEGADHNDTYSVGGTGYFEKVREFAFRVTSSHH